jgi:hypothetical protein
MVLYTNTQLKVEEESTEVSPFPNLQVAMVMDQVRRFNSICRVRARLEISMRQTSLTIHDCDQYSDQQPSYLKVIKIH